MNIIDLVVLLTVVVTAVLSARKGLLMSVFNIAAFGIAGFVAKIFASPVAEMIYESFLKEKVISELNKIMPSGSIEAELYKVVDEVFCSLPEYFVGLAKQFGIYPDLTSVQNSSSFTVEMIEQSYISSILCNVVTVLVLVIMFILISVILKSVLALINKGLMKEKHTVIRRTNMFFGAAFGVIKGLIPAGVICIILNIASPLINNETLSQYVIGSYFCNLAADLLK